MFIATVCDVLKCQIWFTYIVRLSYNLQIPIQVVCNLEGEIFYEPK